MATVQDKKNFAIWLNEHCPWLINFSPEEVLTRVSNVNRGVKNSMPPKLLWRNCINTLFILQILRSKLGVPITITSGFRSVEYNKTLNNSASDSQHSHFTAFDIRSPSVSPTAIHKELRYLRSIGLFQGGIGLYGTFVHVDTRGTNTDWTG